MPRNENPAPPKTAHRLLPSTMKTLWGLAHATFADGAITIVCQELNAVAVALATQSPDCAEIQMGRPRPTGAPEALLH
ncbi:MAG: hypothetical protein ABJF10_09600 [Chthoniobacter sp.]|uniref:hypothetical protein n=1 Tax=Chthoniobacter sp. TaxID=2510640 RepID=UPI0032A1C963